MFIHTVKDGETVFGIARKYAVSPTRIIADNGLLRPDELYVGEELVILPPTRTYTVRGGDTLEQISRRFGVKRQTLLANNPALLGTDRIYPGELLALRYEDAPYGMAAVNGYVYPDCSAESFRAALPYLTYVTVGAAVTDGNTVRMLSGGKNVPGMVKNCGKSILLRVSEADGRAISLPDEKRRTALAEKLATVAKAEGCHGITVAFYQTAKSAPEDYRAFLLDMRKTLLGCDLILFTETDANAPAVEADFADGDVLMYEKCMLPDIPSFADGEESVFRHFADITESSHMFIDIPAFGYDNGEAVTREDIRKRLCRSKNRVTEDEETGICRFSYTRFHGGTREERHVAFESLKNIKAKFALADELGCMGIALDVGRTTTAVYAMINALFSRAEYPFLMTDNP